MIDLNYTNEEIEALKTYINEKNEAMNQLLISNCESDIALLSDEVENKSVSISYSREEIIENLKNIKLIYTLILKNYYKNGIKKKKVYRGTNLSEVERFRNEVFIDKLLVATESKKSAEEEYAAKWSKPTSIKITLNPDVPYINVGKVLETDSKEIIIIPFTRIKDIELASERNLKSNSKLLKVYDITLEKQTLDELTDRERFGLYNHILDNAYLIKRKLEECIKLEKENSVNFENIRKLEQLLTKYENSMEEKEVDDDCTDIELETEYNDIDRVNKELEELKEISTQVFEVRKENINFINSWKRNIAVYMIAECREIEKKFEGLDTPEVEETEEPEEEEIEEETIEETAEKEEIEEDKEKDETEEKTEETEEEKIEIKLDVTEEAKEKVHYEIEDNEVYKRTIKEAEENIEAVETLQTNIKNLITKQQNHAKIAGTLGASYSALNNAFEMRNYAEALAELLNKISLKIISMLKEDTDIPKAEEELEKISKVNIEISTLINYLNNPKIAVRNSKATRFDEMAIIEENELKRGIAERIRNIRGEAELRKLKDDCEIIEEKSAFERFIGIFTGQNKLDEFMLDQIEIRRQAIRKTLSRKMGLAYNYSIHELMAEITMFVDENYDDDLVEDNVSELKNLADELRRNYVILESKVNSIVEEKENKNLPVETKKLSKYDIIEIETYRFLNKYGYDMNFREKEEPKYQDTMASEISRIVEYINSANVL